MKYYAEGQYVYEAKPVMRHYEGKNLAQFVYSTYSDEYKKCKKSFNRHFEADSVSVDLVKQLIIESHPAEKQIKNLEILELHVYQEVEI